MNWLDRIIEKNGDVIFIGLVVIAAVAFVGVMWMSLHWGVKP